MTEGAFPIGENNITIVHHDPAKLRLNWVIYEFICCWVCGRVHEAKVCGSILGHM